jgi:hypothetical protein
VGNERGNGFRRAVNKKEKKEKKKCLVTLRLKVEVEGEKGRRSEECDDAECSSDAHLPALSRPLFNFRGLYHVSALSLLCFVLFLFKVI